MKASAEKRGNGVGKEVATPLAESRNEKEKEATTTTTKKDWLKRGIKYRCNHCGQIERYGGLTRHLVFNHNIQVCKVEDLMANYTIEEG